MRSLSVVAIVLALGTMACGREAPEPDARTDAMGAADSPDPYIDVSRDSVDGDVGVDSTLGDGEVGSTAWQPIPTPPGHRQLLSIWGASDDDIWIVGYTDIPTPNKKSFLHWDGARFNEFSTGEGTLNSVWGSSPIDVVAVDQNSEVWHWEGSGWTGVTLGDPLLIATAGSSADDVWLLGTKSVFHRAGLAASWLPGGTGLTDHPWRVLSARNGEAWLTSPDGFAARWEGGSWHDAPSPGSGVEGMWISAATDLWVVRVTGEIGHYDGAVWKGVASPTSKSLQSVYGVGPNDIWAVGDGGTVLHWDGSRWALEETHSAASLTGVWGTPRSVWAVGAAGTVLRRTRS